MENKIESQLLILNFDCKAEEITKEVNLRPTQIVKSGDVKRNDPQGLRPPILHDKNVWVLQLDVPNNLDLKSYLQVVIEKLWLNAEGITKVAGKYKGELSIFGFSQDVDRMAIHIPQSILQKLSELNLDLDIDIYPIE